MDLQVLISTMNQKDHSILEKMNIQTDAIVINQCDKNSVQEFNYKGNVINFFSFAERGVGLSRNNALMRANADICMMADDDMVFVNGYKKIILDAFKHNPRAEMIMFNVPIHQKDGQTKIKIRKNARVHFFNSFKYGTVNIAFKREAIFKKNIFFSLLFGGGARFGSGEDSIFIQEALRKGVKIFSCTEIIAEIEENKSTWFKGYNDKFFYDKGALFASLSERWSRLIALQFVIRHRKLFEKEKHWLEAYKLILRGIKEVK